MRVVCDCDCAGNACCSASLFAMAFRYCLYFMGMAVMQQRRFFIEIFIHTLIVVRLYTTHFLPLELFLPLMAALFVAQYIK